MPCRLEALDASTTEARAAQLLHGLGFTKTMQQKRTGDFSGGWRMRIALARALFVDPTFLILDGASIDLLGRTVSLKGCLYHLRKTLDLIHIARTRPFMYT